MPDEKDLVVEEETNEKNEKLESEQQSEIEDSSNEADEQIQDNQENESEDYDDLILEEDDDSEKDEDESEEEEQDSSDEEGKDKKKKKRKKPKIDLDISGMSLDDIRNQIKLKERRRSSILEKLRETNKKRNKAKERRDELNQESAGSFSKVSELKDKRDDTNKEIKELKKTRKSVLEELKQLSKKERVILDEIRGNKDENGKAGSKINPKRLNKEIEKLEWQLQTIPNLNLEEQRGIMERIDDLSSQLGIAEVSEAKQRELRDIRKQKSTLKSFLDDSWKQLNELVAASQGRHNRLAELYDVGKKAKQEADDSHQDFIKNLQEANKLRDELRILKAELDILYPAMKGMQADKRKKQDDVKSRKEENIKDSKTKEIKKKLSDKRGLSMEEMKFMLENNLISLKQEKKKK